MSDLISRQAAIDALKKHEIELPVYAPREVDVFWDDAIDCCVSEIEDLPSVQPQRKKGKWLESDGVIGGYGNNGIHITLPTKRCSYCNTVVALVLHKDYCPNCGSYNGGKD